MALGADRETARTVRGASWAKLWRYTTGSVVAAGCSEAAYVVLYGLLHLTPGWSSVGAWLAGALPNFWLNRNWAWQRRGRPSLLREVLPYALVVALTLLLATLATRAADAGLRTSDVGEGLRVVLVAGTFLAVYVAMFVLRFVLLDRLFAGPDPHRRNR